MRQDLVVLKGYVKKEEEKLSNLEEQTSKVHKRADHLKRDIRYVKIVDFFVPVFFTIAIVFAILGIYFYPKGTLETKALVSLTGSALLLGCAGLLLSYQSIRYSNIYARLSMIISDSEKIEDKANKASQEVQDLKKNLSEYGKGQSSSATKL